MLGRLRRGYRVFRLRSMLGTRIELCHLFVKVSFGSEDNKWASPTDLHNRHSVQEQELASLKMDLEKRKRMANGSPGTSRPLPRPRRAVNPLSSPLQSPQDSLGDPSGEVHSG